MSRSPYPLQWPPGVLRSSWRRAAAFSPRFAEDRDAIIRWLRKRGSQIVITSNLPTNRAGLPISSGNRGDDPGIAVWWVEKGKERVIACDRWRTASDNMRAIMKTIEALRGIERWGSAQMVDAAFAGFAALPPGSTSSMPSTPQQPPWREVLGGTWPDDLDDEDLLALAKSRHRKAMLAAHPDKGGDPELATRLNLALAEAEAEIGGGA